MTCVSQEGERGVVERMIERLAGRYIADRIALAVKENDSMCALLKNRAAQAIARMPSGRDSFCGPSVVSELSSMVRR